MSFLIGPEHPDYYRLFDKSFGAGMSYPARLIKNPPLSNDPEELRDRLIRLDANRDQEEEKS